MRKQGLPVRASRVKRVLDAGQFERGITSNLKELVHGR